MEPDAMRLKEIEQEIALTDAWVMARREGGTPDMEALAAELPPVRRGPFLQRLRMTALLQEMGGDLRANVRAALQSRAESPAEPVVVEQKR